MSTTEPTDTEMDGVSPVKATEEATERRAPVQGSGPYQLPPLHPARRAFESGGLIVCREPGTISWAEHELAWEGYRRKFPSSASAQDAERIAQRNGFSFNELIMFLGKEPNTWTPRACAEEEAGDG